MFGEVWFTAVFVHGGPEQVDVSLSIHAEVLEDFVVGCTTEWQPFLREADDDVVLAQLAAVFRACLLVSSSS
ncbi:hypothetical protein R1X32_02535 (plasmid) [Rhodococcus opacus]|uniref:Uncharacterized protein n=1 Tax=Rhodococcus opacus TaxID=37919 RepID=A0ABT4NT03_RHOOP|nr:hypothetical protein [Rhodococcus opacus]MCZ4590518.1 hypothetical protein [Rhodococcus opacus]MDV7087603.1 hypothetical protein [Rhodococcus opacus]WKN61112.1 hypothetical protein HJ581_0046690 [Rhodococcus opacus]